MSAVVTFCNFLCDIFFEMAYYCVHLQNIYLDINIDYVLSIGVCINVVITLILSLVQVKHYVSLHIITTRCHRHTPSVLSFLNDV